MPERRQGREGNGHTGLWPQVAQLLPSPGPLALSPLLIDCK